MIVNGEAMTDMFRALHPDLAAIWDAESTQRGAQMQRFQPPLQSSFLGNLGNLAQGLNPWLKH